MKCDTCKKMITIETEYTDMGGIDIDYEVEVGHKADCATQFDDKIINKTFCIEQKMEDILDEKIRIMNESEDQSDEWNDRQRQHAW